MIRVVVIADRSASLDRLREILAAAPRGSVRVQVRDKSLDGGPLLALVRDALAIARPAGAEVWVNDRVDIALAAGADGVHLPEHGLAIAEARALGAPAIGRSCHSIDGARQAARDGADVVHLGPIWSTPSKNGLIEPFGPEVLGVRLGAPLIAVGGIDSVDRARQAAEAGADAVAVIRAAWTNPPAMIAGMVAAIETARAIDRS